MLEQNEKLRVLILGGRGFVGRAICSKLKKHLIFTFDRHAGRKNHFQGNINSLSDLKKAIRSMDCVINIIGLSPLRKPTGTTYYEAHVRGVKNVLKVCKEFEIKRLVHMSILGANKKSTIEFTRTKGLGEELVIKSDINSTIFCPSIIYDKENEFVRMASKTAFTFGFPNIPAKIQPVYRENIAKLFSFAVEGKIKEKKLEVGGPDVMTIFQFVKKIYNKKGFPCIPIPLIFIKTGMGVASWLNLFGITKDQIKSLYIDNITKSNMAKKYVQLTKFDRWLKRIFL